MRRAQHRYLPALFVTQKLLRKWKKPTFDRVEWVALVDDDTYVLSANLQALLRSMNASSEIYTGQVSPDIWLPDSVDGSNLELPVATTFPFVAGGAGSIFSRGALDRMSIRGCLERSLPGGEWDQWQSDWMLSACARVNGVLPTAPTTSKMFMQFACREDDVIVPCEVSASSEDPDTLDDKPAAIHPVKAKEQMLKLHKMFPQAAQIEQSGVRSRMLAVAEAERLHKRLGDLTNATANGTTTGAQAQVVMDSLEAMATLSPPRPTPWDLFGMSVFLSGHDLLVGAQGEAADGVANAGAVYFFSSEAGEWALRQRVTAPNGHENSYFGSSVHISNDTAVVSAFGEPVDGVLHAGAVYVYTRAQPGGTWDFEQKLTLEQPQEGGYYGRFVSLLGDQLLVGCPNLRICPSSVPAGKAEGQQLCTNGIESAGAVLVYQRQRSSQSAANSGFCSQWNPRACAKDSGHVVWNRAGVLTLPNRRAYDFLGRYVKLLPGQSPDGSAGEYIVASAHGREVGDTQDAGAIYLFGKDRQNGGWRFLSEIVATTPAHGAFFGSAVDVGSELTTDNACPRRHTIVIGAFGEDEAGLSRAGAAYILTACAVLLSNGMTDLTPWDLKARLTAPHPREFGTFGQSVSIFNGTVVVGSKGYLDTAHSGHSVGSGISWFTQNGDATWSSRGHMGDPHPCASVRLYQTFPSPKICPRRAKLTSCAPPLPADGSSFGTSLSMSQMTVAVAVPYTKDRAASRSPDMWVAAEKGCTADFGADEPCCDQAKVDPRTVRPLKACPSDAPKCQGYVYKHAYGECVGVTLDGSASGVQRSQATETRSGVWQSRDPPVHGLVEVFDLGAVLSL